VPTSSLRAPFGLLLLCLGLTACSTAPLQRPSPAASAISGISASVAELAEVMGPDFNGVLLVKDAVDAAPLQASFGMANFERAVANQPATLFQIGSVSKWVTSVAVLRLVDRGVLDLDRPIGAWLPELGASGQQVSLRHLMSNTSGIPNALSPALRSDPASVMQPLSMLQAAQRFAGGAPAFVPGSRFDYVPTNWIVVGAVLERVSGKTFAQVLDEEVFIPAGARSTGLPDAGYLARPDAATPYASGLPRTPKTTPHVTYVAASGTVYSNAADLARLAETVYGTALLSAASRAELSRINVVEESYALGGRVRNITLGGQQRAVAWESGVSGGYKSLLLHVAADGKTVVILNNTDMPQAEQAERGEALLKLLYRER